MNAPAYRRTAAVEVNTRAPLIMVLAIVDILSIAWAVSAIFA